MDTSVDNFDYMQMFNDANTFDSNAGVSDNNTTPFVTNVSSDGTGQMTPANTGSSSGFWSGFGSAFSGLVTAATSATPDMLKNLTAKGSTPSTANQVNGARQTAAGAQPGNPMGMKNIVLIAGAAILAVVLGVLIFKRKKA